MSLPLNGHGSDRKIPVSGEENGNKSIRKPDPKPGVEPAANLP
jgi:hypothetical protein